MTLPLAPIKIDQGLDQKIIFALALLGPQMIVQEGCTAPEILPRIEYLDSVQTGVNSPARP
jgi:hypothetical protein